MIKKLINRLAKNIGCFKRDESKFVYRISIEPLNATLHLQYAVYALGINRPYLALAELKTAEFLGMPDKEVKKYKDKILSILPPQEIMNHNQYFRLKTLSSELNNRSEDRCFSVLDVGGGEGQLASFIPEASYCLVEPTINGISGINLPFPDCSFDYVVSCHVLEHIPNADRVAFLDQLLSKSKYGLILLNPFYFEGSRVEDRLKLVINVTDAEWAKEHLDCSLPTIEFIEKYAEDRMLEINIKPNGTLTTSLALVFFDYLADQSSDKTKIERVNKFFNMQLGGLLDSEKCPNGHMVYISRKKM